MFRTKTVTYVNKGNTQVERMIMKNKKENGVKETRKVEKQG